MTFVHFSSGNVVVVVSVSVIAHSSRRFSFSFSSIRCLLCFDENDENNVSIGKILSFQDKKGKVLIATNLLSIRTYHTFGEKSEDRILV